MATTDKLMTTEELWPLPEDRKRHELVAGELRTMAPSGSEHGWVIILFSGPFNQYVTANKLGLVFGAETGFRLAEDPDTVLAPDVALVSRERVLAAGDVKGYWAGAPVLAVDVISPSDLYTEVDEKIARWLEYGARMVLAVNPRRRVVAIHRPGQPVRIITEDDVLNGEDVVPGWRLPVRDLFHHGLVD